MRRVLLVEDNEHLASLTQLMLAELSYDCVHAATIADARAALAGGSVDLVLTDYRLPDGNGTDLAAACGNRPIVVLSGYDAYDLPREKFPAGTVFRTKPLTFEGLESALQDAVAAAGDKASQ
ncbi:MAG: response regulator [Methylobacterium sp.]|nr:MAG: response regulator [Methylobacterium sp.]